MDSRVSLNHYIFIKSNVVNPSLLFRLLTWEFLDVLVNVVVSFNTPLLMLYS